MRILIFLFALNAGAVTLPKDGIFGPGLSLGTQSAVSGKVWFLERAAFDAGVEYLDKPFAVFYGNFLWHFPNLIARSSRFGREAALYAGAGLGAGFWLRSDHCGRWSCSWSANATGTGNGFFARLLAGAEWYPPRTHYGVFAEVAPSRMIYPASGSVMDVSIGGRYYF